MQSAMTTSRIEAAIDDGLRTESGGCASWAVKKPKVSFGSGKATLRSHWCYLPLFPLVSPTSFCYASNWLLAVKLNSQQFFDPQFFLMRSTCPLLLFLSMQVLRMDLCTLDLDVWIIQSTRLPGDLPSAVLQKLRRCKMFAITLTLGPTLLTGLLHLWARSLYVNAFVPKTIMSTLYCS